MLDREKRTSRAASTPARELARDRARRLHAELIDRGPARAERIARRREIERDFADRVRYAKQAIRG